MQYYKLIESSSAEVIAQFYWDEIASGSITGSEFVIPSGTYLELTDSSSVFTSSISYGTILTRGAFLGEFTGSIVGSFAEFDRLAVNKVFVLYKPSGSDTGSINISTTGSLNVSGSVVSDQFTGSFSGYLYGTASYALTASLALNTVSASYAQTASVALNTISASYAKIADTGSQIIVINKSQNWNPPTWAKKMKVILVGGGGGGGSAPSTEDGIVQYTGGAGGGGGTITFGEFILNASVGTSGTSGNPGYLPSGSISITVGGAGIGGFYDSNADTGLGGSSGGDTLFGDYLVAPGGQGGEAGRSAVSTRGIHTQPARQFFNTGGGAGGKGTIDGDDISVANFNISVAPPIPLQKKYLNKPWTTEGGTFIPWPIPAPIAPTGGGGGLGYKPGDGRFGDGIDTTGGSILQYAMGVDYGTQSFNSVTPITYNSSSYSYYPAYNTKVGLGGKGGNAYLLEGPTDGTNYGGGGGGAYAGGVTGSYTNGIPNGTNWNNGANGGAGVAIIILET